MTVCVHCAHYEERERPQGTCEITKEPTLAWWGCRNDFLRVSNPEVEK